MEARLLERHSMVRRFMKVYPNCNRRDIENLVNAIRSDKYWTVHPSTRDALYIVALTSAKVPLHRGFQARATHVGFVRVVENAAEYCRRGRVLIAVKEGSEFKAVTVVSWPAFLRLIRLDPHFIYRMLSEGGLPPYIGIREAINLSQRAQVA